jgi:hypothetical protein
MTNHIEAIRRLARSVAERSASEVGFALFRLYLAAAGATQSGSWLYVPGRATPLKGFRAAAEYVSHLADTSAFLRNMANALDLGDREIHGPPAADTPLGQQVIAAGDMTPLAARADDLNAVAQHVAELASQLAALGATPPAPDPEAVVVPAGADLPELLAADDRLLDRIVKRSIYTAGVTLLAVLDSWIEGARENTAAGVGHRDADPEQFYADDFRNMVNDAMRELGAPEPYRRPSP